MSDHYIQLIERAHAANADRRDPNDKPLSEPYFDPRICCTSYKYRNDGNVALDDETL